MDNERIEKWEKIRHYLLERDAALFAAKLRQEGILARIFPESVANPLPVVSRSFDLNVPAEQADQALDLLKEWELEFENYDSSQESYHDISKEEIFYLKNLETKGRFPSWNFVVIGLLVLLLISLIIGAVISGSNTILF
ncbi:MAG: hypothetical protein HKN16_11180 [Saprospiraceae bacterium]|nr:hypothetical protein [Saprospiraceae bacterium]